MWDGLNEVNDVHDVIEKDMILLGQDLATKDDVLRLLVQTAEKNGLITAQTPFLEAALRREAQVPTAIGYRIAIPHGKSEVVKRPFVGMLQATSDFLWTEGHEEEVKLIFLIGVPQENEHNIHLKFISKLSKKLLDDNFRDELVDCTDVERAYELLHSIGNPA